MAQSKRNLLVVQNQNTNPGFFRDLKANDWTIHSTQSIPEAIDLIAKHKFLTGFCIVDNCPTDDYWYQLMQLCDVAPRIKWVIALPGECLHGLPVNSLPTWFISEFCHDYLTHPINSDRLLTSLGHAYGVAELIDRRHQEFIDIKGYNGIIGNSPVMRKLYKQIEKVSNEDFAVLLEGETGTGKELIANAIHANSRRAGKAIVAINCGAFPPELIQAELFGFEKGAFTGATTRRIGRIEASAGGTLFLDEIGDLPIAQQVNLLRFLEEKTIERVGGTEKIHVDVRVISATHVNLKQAVKDGKFREDLYYRLRVLQLKTPPLRERENDLELLSWYFFEKFTQNQRRKPKGFSNEALYLMQRHDWPGNIRELMNCIRNAVTMSENHLLTPADLGLDKRKKDRSMKTLEEARAEADRETILSTMRQSHFNMSRAARDLGISRVSLYRLIDKYQLEV